MPISDAQLARPQWSLSDLDRLRYCQTFPIIQTLLSVAQPAAAIYSLIGTAKLKGLDPEAYLRPFYCGKAIFFRSSIYRGFWRRPLNSPSDLKPGRPESCC
jgi:hypothetical protein